MTHVQGCEGCETLLACPRHNDDDKRDTIPCPMPWEREQKNKKPNRAPSKKDWQCQECGRRMTLAAAERATSGIHGCPGCGGADIDLAPRREEC